MNKEDAIDKIFFKLVDEIAPILVDHLKATKRYRERDNDPFDKAKQAILDLIREAKIEELGLLAREGKRVGGFGTVPNLQNYLMLRIKKLKEADK